MKIGILGALQHEALRTALAALLPGAEIISFDLRSAAHDVPARLPIAAALLSCDHVVTPTLGSGFGRLATMALQSTMQRLHVLPEFHFAGFHPDTIGLVLDGAAVDGPTGHDHSRIAIAGFLAGYSPRETADLFNRLSFGRLGYLDEFQQQRTLLLNTYEAYQIELRAAFAGWLEHGCFMHAAHYPRMRVMLDMARVICEMAGLAPTDPAPAEADLPDMLAGHPIHPLFPDIAAAIGVPPAGAFRGAVRRGAAARVLGTEAFVAACQESYRRLPLAPLLQADGVAAAMAALGLELAPRRAAAKPQPGPDTTMFMTWDGRILGMETASSMLVQRQLSPDEPESTDLLIDLPPLPITAPVRSVAMSGVTIAPAAENIGIAGGVTVSRNGRYLRASPHFLAAQFDATAPRQWEFFLPLPAAAVADLRALSSGDWLVDTGSEKISANTVRMLPGFSLALGAYRIDLAAALPQRMARGDGAAAFAVTAGNQPITLQADTAAPPRHERVLEEEPRALRPADCGGTQAFQVARHAALRLPSPPEFLHPPLTPSDADQEWLWKAYFDEAFPVGDPRQVFDKACAGEHTFNPTLFRAPDKLLLLERSMEGVLIGQTGVAKARVAKDWGFLDIPSHWPKTLRAVGRDRMLDLDAAAAAPVIDGPVCVFYNPNLQNYYHWLAEAVVTLHVMAPHLPPNTRLVLPGTLADFRNAPSPAFDHVSFLHALGLGNFPILEIRTPIVHLRDAIWIESDTMLGMPAAALQSFRARANALRPPTGPRLKLYIKRKATRRVRNAAAVEAFVQQHGFTVVTLENMEAGEQIDLFLHADAIIAVHGAGLANLLFCRAGTMVLEMMPSCHRQMDFWRIAQKLELNHGMLACPTTDGGVYGDLNVDLPRLRALFRMLQAVLT